MVYPLLAVHSVFPLEEDRQEKNRERFNTFKWDGLEFPAKEKSREKFESNNPGHRLIILLYEEGNSMVGKLSPFSLTKGDLRTPSTSFGK